MLKIQQTLSKEEAIFFQLSNEPFIDVYGRASFVYCQFLDKQIPVLQPGSLRIESGVMPGSELAILDTENMQLVNGQILDHASSLYICKFLARVVYNYK